MERIPELKPADLLLVGGDWWVSNLIKYFTRYRGEAPTKVHHVAGMISDSTVEEALLTVKKSSFSQGDSKHNYYQIGRNTYLTEEQRNSISKQVRLYTNNFYGSGKLLLHMFDGILGKIFGKDITFFRTFLFINSYPICSGLWAYAYYDVARYKFDYPPYIVSPDDMHDHVKKSEQWKMVYEKGN